MGTPHSVRGGIHKRACVWVSIAKTVDESGEREWGISLPLLARARARRVRQVARVARVPSRTRASTSTSNGCKTRTEASCPCVAFSPPAVIYRSLEKRACDQPFLQSVTDASRDHGWIDRDVMSATYPCLLLLHRHRHRPSPPNA